MLDFREGGEKKASPLDSSSPKTSCGEVPPKPEESLTRLRRELMSSARGHQREILQLRWEFAQGMRCLPGLLNPTV